MLPKWHVLINLVISFILLIFLDLSNVIIFFASSVLMDIDHYFYYLYEKKDYSLKRAYNWNKITRARFHNLSREEKKRHRYFVLIFHGIEILALVLAMSFFSPIFFYVFLGFCIHLIEDLIIAGRFKYFKRKLFLSYAIYLHCKNKVK